MSQTSGIPKTIFSTDFFSAREKMEAYRESIGSVFDVSNIETGNDGVFATLESYLLHEIMLVETETVAQNFFRTPGTVARNNIDHFLIQLFFEGFTAFKKNGEHHFCDSSSLVVIDTSRTWDAFNPHFHHLTLVIPRRFLAKNLWHYDSHHGRLLKSSHNPFVSLLEELMLALYKNLDSIQKDQAPLIMSHTVDLVISTLNFASFYEKNRNQKRHERIINDLMRAQYNISKSTLSGLLDGQGLTSVIREQSLRLAHKRISHLPDPEERYLFRPQIAPAAFQIGAHGSSPYRLWEEWLLSL